MHRNAFFRLVKKVSHSPVLQSGLVKEAVWSLEQSQLGGGRQQDWALRHWGMKKNAEKASINIHFQSDGNRFMYKFGGQSTNGLSNFILRYDALGDSWTTLAAVTPGMGGTVAVEMRHLGQVFECHFANAPNGDYSHVSRSGSGPCYPLPSRSTPLTWPMRRCSRALPYRPLLAQVNEGDKPPLTLKILYQGGVYSLALYETFNHADDRLVAFVQLGGLRRLFSLRVNAQALGWTQLTTQG